MSDPLPRIACLGAALLAIARIAHAASPPDLPAWAASIDGLAPQDWRVLDRAEGDLNADGRPDAAIVIQHVHQPSPHSTFVPESGNVEYRPRILIVALADTEAPGYRFLVANPKLIAPHDTATFDDVLEDDSLRIEAGTLVVTLLEFSSMGSWSTGNTVYKFQIQNDAMPLIGMDRRSIHRGTLDYSDVSINFLSHRVRILAGNEGEDRPSTQRWESFADAAPDLAKIGDGLEYWPENLRAFR